MSPKNKAPLKLRGPLQASRSKPRLTPTFVKEYAKLNSAQKKAIDTIEGPVMAIAGPGTGKTQVVAMRVATILRKTQMRPGNILCLTFSTSGAKAMRERLRALIGPDAYGVTVSTVHSFCNDLILEHPNVFESFQALEQVSEIEQLRIVRACMKKLGPGSVLGKPSRENDSVPHRFGAASRAAAVRSRISEMKREGIAPDDLTKLVVTFQREMETTSNGKKRDISSQAYRDDQRLLKQFQEFIMLYQDYEMELQESHRYDYEDMVLVTLAALQKHDWLLASHQERYQYLLVDEYQDLNGAQHRVIELLATEPLPGQKPNLFVVGDDDQAIYRFQGASLATMLTFLERFPDAAVITLTENYRSTQEILDAAEALIEKNEERLVGKIKGIEKNLTSQVSSIKQRNLQPACPSKPSGRSGETCLPSIALAKEGNLKPQFFRYPSEETELSGIAQILREEHERGTPWSDMALLCRRNEELQALYVSLHAAEIPTVITAKRDLLLSHHVRQAITILRAIEHPENDVILSAALGCETFGIHFADLGRLWMNHRKRNAQRREHATRLSLRELLLGDDQPELFQRSNPPLLHAYHLIEDLHARKETITLPDLLERVLKGTGLLPGPEAHSADPEVITSLHAFYDYVKHRVYEQKSLTLIELLSDLDQYLREPSLKLEYETPHLTSDGVQLMTAHAAKGLEFALVIVPHVRFRNWGDRQMGSLLSLPDHLIFPHDRGMEKLLKQEDERRLLYVAMTRAKEKLVLTFSEVYRSGEELSHAEVSRFIADLEETVIEVSPDPRELPKPLETLWQPQIAIDDAFAAFARERLEDFQLSVTALNAFLEDPQQFLWTHLLLQPQAKAPHLAFGSAVHAALEKRNLAWRDGSAFSTSDLIAAFEAFLQQREVFTGAERAHYLHLGRELLERYGRETEQERPIILSAERKLHARLLPPQRQSGQYAQLSEIPLFGIVDRIDLFQPQGQNCRIIDYKTGKPKHTASSVQKDSNLYRQLVFYKLLCDLSPGFIHTATLFTLDFVGNEREGRSLIDFEITEQEVKELLEVIHAVWAKIIALDFTRL